MRYSRLLLFLISGCSINLEPWEKVEEPPQNSELTRLEGCHPLGESATDLSGRMDTVTTSDGRLFATLTHATTSDGASPTAFFLPTTDSCANRAVEAMSITLDLSSLELRGTATPMASLTTDATTHTYFTWYDETPFAPAGFGLARWDFSSRRLVPIAILWTGDRPNYGSGVALKDGFVYVFGGLAARFLSADIYVARVPVKKMGEPGAYEYWAGGGNWVTHVDRAVALVEGGTEPSVAWDAQHRRWLLAYVTPFANSITLRSGLGLSGPWSRGATVGTCGAFCVHAVLHTSPAANHQVYLSYSNATFDESTEVLNEEWPQVSPLPWPGLP
jgi:Domain of unknown function (DUF4185)